MSYRLACLQMCSGRDVDANVAWASEAVREAARAGAQIVATPEMTSLLETDGKRMFEITCAEEDDQALILTRPELGDLLDALLHKPYDVGVFNPTMDIEGPETHSCHCTELLHQRTLPTASLPHDDNRNAVLDP